MKIFRLKRELPTFAVGDEFELRDDGCLWLRSKGGNQWKDEVMAYHKNTLERFPNILEEWFEEDDAFWFIDEEGHVVSTSRRLWPEESISAAEEIGNRFETKEEAKEAVEKLKAWKRLKDGGFRFSGGDDACISYKFGPTSWTAETEKDFGLLFGGEEWIE